MIRRLAVFAPVLLSLAFRPALAQESRHEVDVRRDIAFVERDDRPLKLDIYEPKDAPLVLPLVVVIHGGAWRMGTKASLDAAVLAKLLAQQGFAAASISYRLVPRSLFPAQIEDCRTALQFLRLHAADFHLDPARAAALGSSAGGHLAALLGTEPDRADPKSADPIARESTRVSCVVSFFGPMDLVPTETVTPEQFRLVKEFLVGRADTNDPAVMKRALDLAEKASPIRFVSKTTPPFLLVHGTADPLVPIEQSKKMADALEKAGVEHDLVRVKGGGHGDFLLPLVRPDLEPPPFWLSTLAFLRRHLGLPAEAAAHGPETRSAETRDPGGK